MNRCLITAVFGLVWSNPAFADGLVCHMERDCDTLVCRSALAEGTIHITDRNTVDALTPVLATEGLIPGDLMPVRLTSRFGWSESASVPSITSMSFDGQTGQTHVAIPPITRPGGPGASLSIAPEGPPFSAELTVVFGGLFAKSPITYQGNCEIAE